MNYLRECERLYPEIALIRTGKRQNFKDMEVHTAEIRRRKSRRLTYEDLEKIRDGEFWNADQFGYWPSRSEIERSLSKHWKFHNLHKNREKEERTIQELLEVFRQIEIVSVILRFINPKRYGILSPPVEKMLGIGPSRDRAKKYQNYLDDLEKLKKSRGFKTAAEVDVALWVLQLGVVEKQLENQIDPARYKALCDGFEQDQELKRIRMGNLAAQLFEDMPRLDLAKALLDAGNPQIAGQIAGCELERRVAKKADIPPEEVRGLREMIEKAWNDQATRVRFQNLVEVRNHAVHRRDLTPSRVDALIEVTKTLEV